MKVILKKPAKFNFSTFLELENCNNLAKKLYSLSKNSEVLNSAKSACSVYSDSSNIKETGCVAQQFCS